MTLLLTQVEKHGVAMVTECAAMREKETGRTTQSPFNRPRVSDWRIAPAWRATKNATHLLQIESCKTREQAGELGFEPRLTDPESVVLPLHYSPKTGGAASFRPLLKTTRRCRWASRSEAD